MNLLEFLIVKSIRICVLILPLIIAASAAAQNTDDSPKLEDFNRTRDITADIKAGKTAMVFPGKKKPVYKLRRIIRRPKPVMTKANGKKNAVRPKEYKLPVALKASDMWEQIGITIWRLESTDGTTTDKDTARMLVQESGSLSEYVPKRVAAETIFRRGEKLRLSIESPRKGYLYIIDREMRDDGTLGEPYLIFPTMMARGGDNRVDAGRVIDIPMQSDRFPFFTLRPAKPYDTNWVGELLTVIVSPDPLVDLPTLEKQLPIASDLVVALEERYLVDINEFEQQGTEGSNYTKTEKEAGDNKRQLTQGDPYPQTVYRVKTSPDVPILINLALAVR